MRSSTAPFACLVLVGALLGPSTVVGQDSDEDPRAHFRRAIEQFNEGNLDAALAEFQRAYAIGPANSILYNIAHVYARQGNAVEAARYYQRYLDGGGDTIDADRRTEVEASLATQRARIGRIELAVSVDGATISVDGADVATSPLDAPLEVSAGTVNIEIRAPHHVVVRRRVTVAGGSVERLVVELQEAVQPGTLRIESSVADVVIEIDGTRVGQTPLAATITLPVGDHRLVARRPGYLPFERSFHSSRNSEAHIELEMRLDEFAEPESLGAVALSLPDAPYEARVDGELVSQAALSALPAGRHRLRLEVDERLPYDAVVDVPGGGQVELAPALEWGPAARQERLDAAGSRRNIGMGLTIGGVVVGITGVSLAIWNESEVSATDAEAVIVQRRVVVACAGAAGTDPCIEAQSALLEVQSDIDRQQVIRGVAWGLGITGIVSTAIGLVLWLGSPNEREVDEAAHAQIDIVPLEGGVMVSSMVPFD